MIIRDRIRELRRVPRDKLRANPANWREHTDEQRTALNVVLERIGYAGAVIAREDDAGELVLIDGHLRTEEAGPEDVLPVLILDVNEQEANELLLSYDPLGSMAIANSEKLALLLAESELDNEHLEATIRGLIKEEAHNVPAMQDMPPPHVAPAVATAGDIWILGEHRLMCGDCRNGKDVARLCEDSWLNLAITSPPYADRREYDTTSSFRPIRPDDYVEWWEAVQANIAARLADDGSFFVNIKAGADELCTELYVFDLVIAMVRRWRWYFATELCWERIGIPMRATRRFKNQFEPIYQFARGPWKFRPDAVRHESDQMPQTGKGCMLPTNLADIQGSGLQVVTRRQGNSLNPRDGDFSLGELDAKMVETVSGYAYPGNRLPTFAETHEALGHAAAFPVGLPAFLIRAYTDPLDVVYEPFAGSGSTLIAAEQTKRRCRAMEVSPAYCDMTIERWQNFTGEKATRV